MNRRDEAVRTFDLEVSEEMSDLHNRLVIGWRAPRTWQVKAARAAPYPVVEIADAQPVRFPGFDALVLDYARLRAVVREHRYGAWRTALSSVAGIYLITDTCDGRHYVGKADGAESILQRWTAYASNGHGGNVRLRGRDPTGFRFSLLPVFGPSTPEAVVNARRATSGRARLRAPRPEWRLRGLRTLGRQGPLGVVGGSIRLAPAYAVEEVTMWP